MSESLPFVWMNVTTSVGWSRPAVGIVRVEQSLCAELARLYGERFRLCVWRDGKFVEWLARDSEGQFGIEISEARLPVESHRMMERPLIFPLLPRRKALAAIGQGLLSLMPNAIRPYCNWLLCSLRPYIIRFLNGRWPTLFKLWGGGGGLNVLAERVPVKKELFKGDSIFSSNDILISMGLDWDREFYKEFYFLRKQQQIKIVTCCYDLIPVLYPQYCVGAVSGLFTSYFLEIADGSDLILCISRQSEKDLNNLLSCVGGARPVTHVFPLGDNVPADQGDEISIEISEICKRPFIIFVSTIERRKNHEVLYRAYHLLCAEGKRDQLPILLFVGMQGWGVGDLMKDIELDPLTSNLIVCKSHVTDAELRSLYDAARFCVFPSLYEGWGLPVGEALSLGKAVLCSDRGSLPEVGGEAVRYVDPWDVRSWADEIYKMATDDAWRLEWEKKASSLYHKRTWVDAAVSVKKAIDSCV